MRNRMVDRQFRAVLDNAPDGVLVEARDRVAYVNPPYARMLGYSSVTEFPETIANIAHPEDLERLAWFGRCREQGKPAPTRYTFRACGRHGTVVTFDASISMNHVDGVTLITTIVRELQGALEPRELEIPGLDRLSPRELEVIRHLLSGKRSKEVALLMDVSEKTIGTHRSRAFQKLALRGVADLFRLAHEPR